MEQDRDREAMTDLGLETPSHAESRPVPRNALQEGRRVERRRPWLQGWGISDRAEVRIRWVPRPRDLLDQVLRQTPPSTLGWPATANSAADGLTSDFTHAFEGRAVVEEATVGS